ncbi:lactonase family protein [Chryseolinea lacunae]|uniref:Lactonase family protein n=1 Tax=Chryseolinea lacunae TaxID=2801331 RepID=A0ABS1KY06_9BACT|nr:lactonase family protein [Chryseolinea lacunae]MBL0744215.1 lactonase family protein [Chryseolinea lacunae]
MKNLLLSFSLLLIGYAAQAQSKKEIMYVGTYSVRGSQGIYAFTFDRAKRTLKPLQTVPGLESPNYLAIHPTGKFLYSVNSGKANAADSEKGSVSAYGIDPKTGRLSGLNNRSSYGDGPCHITIDKTGQFAFISNYSQGNLVVLPLFDDGLLGTPSDAKKYVGNSVNPKRQESPHIHSTLISPDNKFLYVADLGTDKVYVYDFDAKEGHLQPASSPEVPVTPGAGPRHMALHPNGKFAYVAEELTSTVGVFTMNKTTGAWTVVEDTVRSLPVTFKEQNTSADIHIDPKGKFLYMSNRGLNALSIFSISPTTGKLTFVGNQDVGGKTPRNFLMDPKGEFIFVANMETDNIVTFKINPKTGKLTAVGKPVKVPSPVCLKLHTL